MDFLGIIPSRYASSRFPGKPLVRIAGKPMVQWVYERSQQVLENVYVATDDLRVFKAVEEFGGKALMTSPEHGSGTDRCQEAMELITNETGRKWDVVINIQGDEPFIRSSQIKLLQKSFEDPETEIATLIKEVESISEIFDENKPKVVTDINGFALIFSRSPLPFIRGENRGNWINHFKYHRHVGIYAYRSEVLDKISKLQPSRLEKAESLEQLRWLENGFRIKAEITDHGPPGIDTPADLELAERYIDELFTPPSVN